MAEQSPRSAWHLGQLFGIDIYLHISVLVIFVLVVSSLSRLLLEWHPDWNAISSWGYAFVAGLLFFISLLLHELSHSVTARHLNVTVERITLFLFGGVAEMQGEPGSPRDEFLIAGAGPLASIVLAIVFGFVAVLLIPPEVIVNETVDFSALSGMATVFLWLSVVNFVVAVFNLLPGFPMDGGRLFRAALWWHSGDYAHATRKAAGVGGFLGWILIGLGFLQLLSGQLVNGIWTMLIGWFIGRLARASVTQLIVQQTLSGFDVESLMRTHFERVPASTTLQDFIEQYALRSNQQVWPVSTAGTDQGLISLNTLDLERHRENGDLDRDVSEFMQRLPDASSLSPDTTARDALTALAELTVPVPVIESGRVVGIVSHADILRWLNVHDALDR